MEKPLNIPASLEKTVTENWGDCGSEWLRALPNILEACASEWGLFVEESAFDLSYNYVVPVTCCDGTRAVIKIGLEIEDELSALEAFHGKHSVAILKKNEARGAMLFERVNPGTTLKELQATNDEQATRIAARLIHEMPVAIPSSHNFARVSDCALILEKEFDDAIIPKQMILKAKKLSEELDVSKSDEKLLHGDLHHDNILFDEKRGWLSIDPKGVIGDPVFNAARFLRNPYHVFSTDDGLFEMTKRRVSILSETLNVDESRIIGWAYVDALIGACWSAENNGGSHEQALRCARVLESLG